MIMKYISSIRYSAILLTFLCLGLSSMEGQDTFSIVAVDPETGQVGTAGASCLDDGDIAGGVSIIGDLLPGKGAINTQSYWHPTNQQNARTRMESGDSPEEIMTWLSENDVQGTPLVRQYGAADFDEDGNPRAAAFTGAECFDYKNHIIGDHYAIQGNILLGQEILDSMETRYLAENGSLAEKLMAALQGANVPGADTRCASQFTSSESSFIKVAQMDDDPDSLYLDIVVGSTPFGSEPIDALQDLFDEWLVTNVSSLSKIDFIKVYPNPANAEITFEIDPDYMTDDMYVEILDRQGKLVFTSSIYQSKQLVSLENVRESGVYFYKFYFDESQKKVGRITVSK